VNSIDVNFTNDYEVTYFSTVPIHYYGFTQTVLDLVSAENNAAGDVTLRLSSRDQDYTYLDSTCVITLRFQDDTHPEQGMIRDYVIEFNGHYTIQDDLGFDGNNVLYNLTDKTENPYSYKLDQNYPNPFNPKTLIEYNISKDANTSIKVYNLLGQLLEILVNSYQKAGEYKVIFNGEIYPSGVYFYKLESGDFVETRKMVLIK